MVTIFPIGWFLHAATVHAECTILQVYLPAFVENTFIISPFKYVYIYIYSCICLCGDQEASCFTIVIGMMHIVWCCCYRVGPSLVLKIIT